MRPSRYTLIAPVMAAVAVGALVWPTGSHAPSCATVKSYPGTFHTAGSTTAAQAAEGIALLGLHQRNYVASHNANRHKALLVGHTFAVAVRTIRPGTHRVLGLLTDSPADCKESAVSLLRAKGSAFLE